MLSKRNSIPILPYDKPTLPVEKGKSYYFPCIGLQMNFLLWMSCYNQDSITTFFYFAVLLKDYLDTLGNIHIFT